MEEFNFNFMKGVYTFLLFGMIILTLTINVIGFLNNVYGTDSGKLLSLYNCCALCIETILYRASEKKNNT